MYRINIPDSYKREDGMIEVVPVPVGLIQSTELDIEAKYLWILMAIEQGIVFDLAESPSDK